MVHRLIRLNPEGGLSAFTSVLGAFASWRRVGCEGLRNDMASILHSYKALLAPAGRWDAAWGSVSEPVRGKLTQMFGPF